VISGFAGLKLPSWFQHPSGGWVQELYLA